MSDLRELALAIFVFVGLLIATYCIFFAAGRGWIHGIGINNKR